MKKDSTSHLKGTQCPLPLQSPPKFGVPQPLAYQELGDQPPPKTAK